MTGILSVTGTENESDPGWLFRYLFLISVLMSCIFQGFCLFHLSCHIYWWTVIHNSSYFIMCTKSWVVRIPRPSLALVAGLCCLGRLHETPCPGTLYNVHGPLDAPPGSSRPPPCSTKFLLPCRCSMKFHCYCSTVTSPAHCQPSLLASGWGEGGVQSW